MPAPSASALWNERLRIDNQIPLYLLLFVANSHTPFLYLLPFVALNEQLLHYRGVV